MLRSRILWKLYGGYVLLILLATITVGVLIGQRIQRDTMQDIRESLETKAAMLGDIARTPIGAPFSSKFQRAVKDLGEETRTRLTVIRGNGEVVADSDEDPLQMDNHASRPEVLDAKHQMESGRKGTGQATRFSATVGLEMMYLAMTISEGDRLLGYVRTSLPLTVVDERLARLRGVVVLAAGIAAILALVLGFFVAKRITAPLTSMTEVAEAIADGDYRRRVGGGSEDEIGKLARAFDTMADQLEGRASELRRLETVRSEFVANASHELKTPITAIRGLVDTLVEDKEIGPNTRARFLEKVRRQSDRLSTLVGDLLTLSRLESHRSAAEGAFDMCDPVLESVRALSSSAEKKDLQVGSEVSENPVTVTGDVERVREIVDNLLDNAIKYTSAPGRVHVRLKAEGGWAVLIVEDDGIGIEPGEQERIFERFYRVDRARSRELGGTGLGLAIVKHAVVGMGGEVAVESVPGSGSKFTVRLPLASGCA